VSKYTFADITCSPELCSSLQRAREIAIETGYAEITEQHLLLALTEDPNARILFADANVNLHRFRTELENELPRLVFSDHANDRALPLTHSLNATCEQAATVVSEVEPKRDHLHSMVVLALLTYPPDAPAARLRCSHGLNWERATDVIRGSYRRVLRQGGSDVPYQSKAGHAIYPNFVAKLQATLSDLPSSSVRPGIFICYRRAASGTFATLIHESLIPQFGIDFVFMDVDISPGDDYVNVIGKVISKCRIFLAIIGPGWPDVLDERGKRRLDDPNDVVRTEIAIALALRRRIHIIPILADGASMPIGDQLPGDIRPLARRNAIDMRLTAFERDMKSLVSAIDTKLGAVGRIPEFLRRK
jgi:hypothetical protein